MLVDKGPHFEGSFRVFFLFVALILDLIVGVLSWYVPLPWAAEVAVFVLDLNGDTI